MKSKLLNLTAAALMVFTIKTQAQVQAPATLGTSIFVDGFESWAGSPTQPTVWQQIPNTTLPATAVTQGTATNTAQSGSFYCNLQNTTTTYSFTCTAPSFSVTAGTAYAISYYARGKGDISVGLLTGTVVTGTGGAEPISGKGWFRYHNTVTATTTTNNAQFFIKVKETGTYTKSGVTVTGIDVDSFVVQPYTPVANVNLYSLQFTNATNGNSPFWGQSVGMTGGIVTAVQVGSTGVDGYYVQNSGANTWAAMSVYDFNNAPLVHVGDSITFSGSVDEFFNMTQMSNISNFTNVSTGNGHKYIIDSLPLTMQTMAQEEYESMLITIQDASMATAGSYTSSYGQATMTDVSSGVSGLVDLKDGFYAPNGNATSGSSGTPGYVPLAATNYCFVGNVYYTFGFNIEPRCSTDVYVNCTTLAAGIQKYNNALHANVYPNPVNNQLTIQLPTEASKISVSFTDVLGKEVMTMNNLSGNAVSINDITLPAGAYMMKITADGVSQITKVIKQ